MGEQEGEEVRGGEREGEGLEEETGRERCVKEGEGGMEGEGTEEEMEREGTVGGKMRGGTEGDVEREGREDEKGEEEG